MRVLVAEDVPSLADDIAEGLRDHGFAVDVAYDGLDAASSSTRTPITWSSSTAIFPAFTATRSAG